MAEIKKIKNIQKEKFLQNLEKSYIEGVYSDSFLNRKLGRVGISYKQSKMKDPDLFEEIGSLGESNKYSNLTNEEKKNCIQEVFKCENQSDGSLYRTKWETVTLKLSDGIWYFLKNGKKKRVMKIDEVFKTLVEKGIQKEDGALNKWISQNELKKETKIKLENKIKDIEGEIDDLEEDLYKTQINKEGLDEALKMEEEGTENYQGIKEKLDKFNSDINYLEDKIKDKKEIKKEYQIKLDKINLTK